MANRTMLVCLAVTGLLALTAGVALAKTITGTEGRDNLDGTRETTSCAARTATTCSGAVPARIAS